MNDGRFEYYKVISSHVQWLQDELRNQKEPAGHWIRDYWEKTLCQPQRKGSQAKQDSDDKPLKAKASANGFS